MLVCFPHLTHKSFTKKKKISNTNNSNSSSINQSMSTINTLPRPFLFCFVSCLSVLNADCPVAPQVSSACLRRGWWRRRSRLLLNPPQSRDVTTGRGLTVTGALFLFFRLNSAYCRRLFLKKPTAVGQWAHRDMSNTHYTVPGCF